MSISNPHASVTIHLTDRHNGPVKDVTVHLAGIDPDGLPNGHRLGHELTDVNGECQFQLNAAFHIFNVECFHSDTGHRYWRHFNGRQDKTLRLVFDKAFRPG